MADAAADIDESEVYRAAFMPRAAEWGNGKSLHSLLCTLEPAWPHLLALAGAKLGDGAARPWVPAEPKEGAIDKAYKKATLHLHPDRVSKRDLSVRVEAEEVLKVLTLAHADKPRWLRDPPRSRSASAAPSPTPPPVSAGVSGSSLRDELFGGGGGGGSGNPFSPSAGVRRRSAGSAAADLFAAPVAGAAAAAAAPNPFGDAAPAENPFGEAAPPPPDNPFGGAARPPAATVSGYPDSALPDNPFGAAASVPGVPVSSATPAADPFAVPGFGGAPFAATPAPAADPFAAGLGGGPFAAAPAPAPAAVAPVGAAPSDDPFAAAFSESCSCGSVDPFGAAPFSGAAAPVAPSAGGGALDPALFGGAPPANPFG